MTESAGLTGSDAVELQARHMVRERTEILISEVVVRDHEPAGRDPELMSSGGQPGQVPLNRKLVSAQDTLTSQGTPVHR
jgi:hypothetical protein